MPLILSRNAPARALSIIHKYLKFSLFHNKNSYSGCYFSSPLFLLYTGGQRILKKVYDTLTPE